MQGERDDFEIEKHCKLNNACRICIPALIESFKSHNPETVREIGIRVFMAYAKVGYNVVMQDRFETNKSVSKLAKLADAQGYEIQFVRLPTAIGEVLTWAECFVC